MFDNWDALPFLPEITGHHWAKDVSRMLDEDEIESERQYAECLTTWCMTNI